ncbi:MAG: dicarboxylate/amino acid:cation symporter [Acidobacteriota bacterium]|nr:dicarboxylate/amino acid:cation symporter [Acidobacteriota bacterium]MDH3524640.1 dicarboxylate/amino acid:cation symporter [Acidobacteriota bacterium]
MSAAPAQGRWESLRRLVPIVAAVAGGVAIGTWAEGVGSVLAPFGTLYLSLLLMCVIPIIGAAVVSSLGRLVANHKLGRNLVVIVLVFWIGMLMAAAIGTGVGWITGVGNDLRTSPVLGELLLEMESTSGEGIVGDGSGATRDERYVELFEGRGTEPAGAAPGAQQPAEDDRPRLVTYLDNLIPRNLIEAYLDDNYLAVLFFSILLGVAMGFVPAATRDLALGVVEALFDSLLRIISWIIYLLPAGLLCIVAGQVAAGGLEFVSVFRKVILVGLATTLTTMAIFTVTIWRVRGIGPLQVLRRLREPLLVAFATSSSFASIPAAMVALKEGLGLKRENVNLFLPLGMTMNPIGSALFFSLSAIFVVQLHGAAGSALSLGHFFLLILGSVLAGLAAMGLPGVSALWMLGLVLEPIGVPPEVGIVALLAVAPIIDPLFTMVNVFGNCTATTILDRYLG